AAADIEPGSVVRTRIHIADEAVRLRADDHDRKRLALAFRREARQAESLRVAPPNVPGRANYVDIYILSRHGVILRLPCGRRGLSVPIKEDVRCAALFFTEPKASALP